MSQGYMYYHGHNYHHHEEYSMSSIVDEFELPIISHHPSISHKPLTKSSSSKNYSSNYCTKRDKDYGGNETFDYNPHRDVHRVPSNNDEYYNTHRDRRASKGFGVNRNYYNNPEVHKKVQFVEREVEPRGDEYKVYKEENISIDSEADGFIKQIRKKFDRCRSC